MEKSDVDVQKLFHALDQKRKSKRLSWRMLSAEIGVSASTFTRVSLGQRPDVDNMSRMLTWLGLSLSDILHGEARSASADTLTRISIIVHSDPRLTEARARALEEIIRVSYAALASQEPDGDERGDGTRCFTRVESIRDCGGDGHYMCAECGMFSVEKAKELGRYGD